MPITSGRCTYRGAVDFDDLIRLALQALGVDAHYLERLRHQWPFILEDEAQDSSHLQETILELLAGPGGNWVRVGDPNQAIYETFTTASPQYLRDFMGEPDVAARELPNSGRSTQSIIDLANYLIDWTRGEHPVRAAAERAGPPAHRARARPATRSPTRLTTPDKVTVRRTDIHA